LLINIFVFYDILLIFLAGQWWCRNKIATERRTGIKYKPKS